MFESEIDSKATASDLRNGLQTMPNQRRSDLLFEGRFAVSLRLDNSSAHRIDTMFRVLKVGFK
jgi:hypothetical protein